MTSNHSTLLIADQITGLLGQLDDATYSMPMSVFQGSTVGQHVRHILEFYVCLLVGAAEGRVDYSARKRNEMMSEKIAAALAALEFIGRESPLLDEDLLLFVEGEFGEKATNRTYVSSVGREMQYAFDHAVHHLAIIRIGLEINCPQIVCDPDLGIAPSTLKYQQKQNNPIPINTRSDLN